MIYYKFLYKPDFIKRLNVSKADFEQIFYPIDEAKEDYCYVEVSEDNFDDFMDYFGHDGQIINPDSNDWPESIDSVTSGRDKSFSVVKPK